MTDVARVWPALREAGPLPTAVSYQHAIWGKLRGTDEDFHWLGRTRFFDAAGQEVERRLALGSEDYSGEPALFWKILGNRCYAVRMHPSRAVDAAGRRGLEKYYIEGEAGTLPMAALAAVLLDEASTRGEAASGTSLQLHHGEMVTLQERSADVARPVSAMLQEGVANLRAALGRDELVNFYDALIANRRPAVLCMNAPPGPHALAALLLPLEPEEANRVSLAGWIVSSRFEAEQMSLAWDGIVYESVPSEFGVELPTEHRPRAEMLASMLLDGTGLPLSASASVSGMYAAPPVQREETIRRLIAFAESPDRAADLDVPRPATVTAEERDTLQLALYSIREQLDAPPRLDAWLRDYRRQHLQRKIALIRKTALTLDPTLETLDWNLE